MASSSAKTVTQYLKELPPERRAVVKKVRDVVKDNLPDGYREQMLAGMICWTIPKEVVPETYNGQPLCYAGLAAQKNYYALYLMSVYGDKESAKRFTAAYKKSGKKLDMGKSCVRFKSVNDLPLDVVGDAIASMPAEKWVAIYEKAHAGVKKKRIE